MQIGSAEAFGFSLANIVQHVGDDDVGAFGHKTLGTAQANATGRASNDGGTVLEFHS
jgi:hypothetical protein